MEKINTEELISALFIVGFDKIDSLLFTYTLGKLSIDNRVMQTFEFEDKECSDTFNKYVTYDNDTYHLVEDCDIDTFILVGDKNLPLRKILHTNKKLITYLSLLDFSEIVLKKIMLLGDNGIDTLASHFCDKEREIISKLFGINEMNQRKMMEGAIAYEKIYDEEAHELDMMSFDNNLVGKIIARDEEIVRLSTSYDYIEWLKKFTDKQGDFYTDDFESGVVDINDEDHHNVNILNIFYDAIDEYANKKKIASINNGDDYYYLIKYNNIGFKIGFIYGQGTIFYCERTIPNEKAIDFADIIKTNTRRKVRIRKKTI